MSTYIDTFIFWYTMAMAFVTRWTIFIICTILYNASLSDALSFSFQYISALLMTFTFDVFPFPTWIALIYTDTLQIVSETFGYQVEKSPEVTLTFWKMSEYIITTFLLLLCPLWNHWNVLRRPPLNIVLQELTLDNTLLDIIYHDIGISHYLMSFIMI